jgi:hypothetical protein
MLHFIDRIRVAAAHDSECVFDRNPLQRAYEACVGKLSSEDRGELVRIINKLSQQLEEQELRHVTQVSAQHSEQRKQNETRDAALSAPLGN